MSAYASSSGSGQPNRPTPQPDLPVPGVLFGLLWVAGAFASLFYCFYFNHLNKPPVPSEELAIASAAAAQYAADHGAGEPHPGQQP